MDRDRAKQEILERSREYFTPDKSKKGFICPICGSGSGSHGTGITTRDGTHYTCWTGCFTSADIFEITGIEHNLTTFPQQLEYLAGVFGIILDDPAPRRTTAAEDFQQPIENGAYIPQDPSKTRATPAPEPVGEKPRSNDYTNFYLQANKHITETDYHRGLSLATLNRFNVGFVPNWRSPAALAKGKKPPKSPRLIVPTSRESYLARDTRPADQLNEISKEYVKMHEGETHLFNPAALAASDGSIFIVEGEIDAMSIEEVGGAAIGLGSMSNGNLLLQATKNHKPTQPLIIALDNDSNPKTREKVRSRAKELQAALKQEGLKAVIISDLWGEYKDPNEMLQADRSRLEKIVSTVSRDPEEWEKVKYLNTFADKRTAAFTDWIFSQQGKQYTPTGFKELDNILNGGLYGEKLYAIGAISSLGKTTLVMQIADNIARAGRDVLIFSLEMSEFELYGKSISRLTYEITRNEGGEMRNAKTELGITQYERYSDYNGAELALISRATEEHRDIIGKHKKVVGAIGGYTVDDIKAATEKHISFTGNTPVVIIDYVQILESTDPHLSDKQKTDHDITALKRLAVEYKLPIIVISSLNRQNYKTPISYEAFKESGAIEYSVDVLIGLQLHGVGSRDFDVDQAKQADPREIELVLLKQRQGKTGLKIGYNYYPMFNYFEETGIIERGAYKDDQTEGSGSHPGKTGIDKAAFKAEWNLMQSQQLESGFNNDWLLEQWGKLLARLDRTTDLYITYRKKYDKVQAKADKERAKQIEIPGKGE